MVTDLDYLRYCIPVLDISLLKVTLHYQIYVPRLYIKLSSLIGTIPKQGKANNYREKVDITSHNDS